MKNNPPIKQKYVTPEELNQLWVQYKTTIDTNPEVQEIATGKGMVEIRTKRPYLRSGFEAFVYNRVGYNVHQYIDNYEGRYEAYLGIVTHMRNEWQTDQIEGTLTGRYKAPNLVARINGLTEKTENDNKHSGGFDITLNLT